MAEHLRVPAGAEELVQQLRALAAFEEDLGLIPNPYMVAHNKL